MKSIPSFLYGTAWKEERTAALVADALTAGFRGFDTANQRKHYFEQGLGEALSRAFSDGVVTRDELFLQTKFTFARGQDHRLPFDPSATFGAQVEQSFRSSLAHLAVDRLDSLVLHGPTHASGLCEADREVWRAMTALRAAGGVTHIGISNVTAEQLALLLEEAVPPHFVQNRCYASKGWDAEVRAICAQHQVRYQGFSLLTANREVLRGKTVQRVAKRLNATPEQVIFRFAIAVGMLPLTGTSKLAHMRLDLESANLELTTEELEALQTPNTR
jgi:diketogulonate reductase-like aldo/keto reductase